MDTTPLYSLPYLEMEDPPNIPEDGRSSMLAVEAQIQRLDAADTAEAAARVALAARGPGSLITYTASGTLTALQVGEARAVRVRAWGGGGGSGGAPATGVGQSASSSGAGGGSYAESIIAVSALALPVTVTVGAAGTAGAAGATTGGNGGASSFGALVAAGGGGANTGPGAAGATLGTVGIPGPGGTATAGQILMTGESGQFAIRFAAASSVSGQGGAAPFGSAQIPRPDAPVAGQPGIFPGGGACGANLGASMVAVAGGLGALGLVTVELLY